MVQHIVARLVIHARAGCIYWCYPCTILPEEGFYCGILLLGPVFVLIL
ncbi:hypothetical protein [Richelia intracellularis]|nr:hypothetical protein [Richelia intracellularis]